MTDTPLPGRRANAPPSVAVIGGGPAGLMAAEVLSQGGARVDLSDAPDAAGGCLLRYEVQADVGGKIAQLGSRLIKGVASKTAEQFFANFALAVSK